METRITSNFKTWKKQVNKDIANFELGRDDAIKKILSFTVTEAREDGFLTASATGKGFYKSVTGATIARKRGGPKVFHHSKFVPRTGRLRAGFADLSWGKNTASNGTDIRASVKGGSGTLAISGYSETTLRYHPVNRKSIRKIGEGDSIRISKSDRGIVQRAGRKVVRNWKQLTKKAIDARLAKRGLDA